MTLSHLCLLLICTQVMAEEPKAANPYIGSTACADCHQQNFSSWQTSDHSKSMTLANENSVLGNFKDITVSFHSINSRFYIRDSEYYVETMDERGTLREFRIKYTFGHSPLQQYLIETEKGRLQALNIAWDSRPQNEGGQRWFHLRPDELMTTSSPFFWTKHLQNWNSRCADCHSTNVSKSYTTKDHTYKTVWSEINVGCEACHGPGKNHAEGMKHDPLSLSADYSIPANPIKWQFKTGNPIAQPTGTMNNSQINLCGGCHSRRSLIGENDAEAAYHDRYRLALLSEPLYHPDGQIEDEVFVLGSFLQSKMYQKGVTCNNCHNTHSGKLLVEGNALCSQCHQSSVYDTPKHHFHESTSAGAQCVECHMPETTYMQVDARRDHRFGVPNAHTSKQLDTPNACTTCHRGSTNDWAINAFKQWNISSPPDAYAQLSKLAQSNDPLTTLPIVNLLADELTPPIKKATLLEYLSAIPSRVSIETAVSYLSDSNPVIRRAAVRALQPAPLQVRWQALDALIEDPVKSVRLEVASILSDAQSLATPGRSAQLKELLNEYRASLEFSNDSPSGLSALGTFELNLGNVPAAKSAYEDALSIEPQYIPARLNLADLYRASNDEANATQHLKQAVKDAPDSSAANFSYGLSLIRTKKYAEALPFLNTAAQMDDSQPHYAYVYAVALDNESQTQAAVRHLEKANLRWPNQYELLLTHILYLEKLNQPKEIADLLSRLSKIAPNSPEVKRRIKQYQQ